MQQGGIQQGSFDGPAKGLEAAGEAVGQAGNVFQQVGERCFYGFLMIQTS